MEWEDARAVGGSRMQPNAGARLGEPQPGKPTKGKTITKGAVLMIDFLHWLDPLKWIDDTYTAIRNGRGVLITWDATSTTGAEVEALLRAYGVRVYGRRYPTRTNPVAGCHVRSKQAKFADGLLRGHGIAVLSKPLSKPIKPLRQWGAPAPAQGLGGLVGDALGIMNDTKHKQRRERY